MSHFVATSIAVVASFVLASLLAPLIIRVAHARGWLDQPRGRHAHATAVPRLGGLAVIIAPTLALALWFALHPWHVTTLGLLDYRLVGVALGAVVVFALGVFDDAVGLRPRSKLFVQTFAALLFVLTTDGAERLAFVPGGAALSINEPLASLLLLLWVVGITNAVNFIDGLDGLAASFAVLGFGVALVAAPLTGASLPGVLPLVMIAALLAFLRFNRTPARLFLGDSGSMTLGYLLATYLVLASTSTEGVMHPVLPLCALAFPLADIGVAMFRRWLRGLPMSQADDRHIHHRVRDRGLSHASTVAVLLAVFVPVAGLGVIVVATPADLLVPVTLGAAFVVGYLGYRGLRALRYEEFAELRARFGARLANMFDARVPLLPLPECEVESSAAPRSSRPRVSPRAAA